MFFPLLNPAIADPFLKAPKGAFLITPIPPVHAEPYVIAYCNQYRKSYMGDPSFGLPLVWFGAFIHGHCHGVTGLLDTPDGIYVNGYYHDGTALGTRACLAMMEWGRTFPRNMLGHIRIDNPKMLRRVLKEGWHVCHQVNESEYLVHRDHVVKCERERLNVG